MEEGETNTKREREREEKREIGKVRLICRGRERLKVARDKKCKLQ
jgi:hypothetical protein